MLGQPVGKEVKKDCISGMLAWHACYMIFQASQKDNIFLDLI
jgi:hypothetical protein